MRIKTQGSQTFNVPNDEEGREFLELLRKFRNRGWYYRARGRGSRQEHGCQHGIDQEHSEWMAVYLSKDGSRSAVAATSARKHERYLAGLRNLEDWGKDVGDPISADLLLQERQEKIEQALETGGYFKTGNLKTGNPCTEINIAPGSEIEPLPMGRMAIITTEKPSSNAPPSDFVSGVHPVGAEPVFSDHYHRSVPGRTGQGHSYEVPAEPEDEVELDAEELEYLRDLLSDLIHSHSYPDGSLDGQMPQEEAGMIEALIKKLT